jgi:hypothetical protein
MPQFYSLDRLGTLNENIEIGLTCYSDISPAELQQHVDLLFPDGLSRHGERYFLKNYMSPRLSAPSIEMLFEYVRRACYPERPSRFQSMFAFESLNEAVAFKSRYGNGQGTIWQIESIEYFKADMGLLVFGNTILVHSYLAHKYWKGEAGQNPIWEVLLIPPIRVIKRAAIDALTSTES